MMRVWRGCAADRAVARRPPPALRRDRSARAAGGRPVSTGPYRSFAQYDVRDVLAALVDGGRFDEYRAEYGKTLVCGFLRDWAATRWGSWRTSGCGSVPRGRSLPVRRRHLRRQRRKAGRFVLDCNQGVFRCCSSRTSTASTSAATPSARDHPAWGEAGQRGEQQRRPQADAPGRPLLRRGYYALCGKAFDPRFLFAWPGPATP